MIHMTRDSVVIPIGPLVRLQFLKQRGERTVIIAIVELGRARRQLSVEIQEGVVHRVGLWLLDKVRDFDLHSSWSPEDKDEDDEDEEDTKP
jgi:hypothetical protein